MFSHRFKSSIHFHCKTPLSSCGGFVPLKRQHASIDSCRCIFIDMQMQCNCLPSCSTQFEATLKLSPHLYLPVLVLFSFFFPSFFPSSTLWLSECFSLPPRVSLCLISKFQTYMTQCQSLLPNLKSPFHSLFTLFLFPLLLSNLRKISTQT